MCVFVGLHTIKSESEFVGNQALEIRDKTENADAAGDGGGFSEDIIGTSADHIATRGSYASHRHDKGFLSLQLFDGMPDLLRGCCRAARRIDA